MRVDLQSVMKQLEAWEHPKMRAVNAKHGAGENQFGVNLGTLRGRAGKIKRDHELALQLWQSGNIDAMNLATLIMDPKQLTQPQVETLAKDLSYYTTTDWFTAYAGVSEKIVSRNPLGSLTSNARLFHSVSCGSDLSVMPAFLARLAISSTVPGVVEMDKRTPIPFLRSRPFFQSS
jgi:hypothetical protein